MFSSLQARGELTGFAVWLGDLIAASHGAQSFLIDGEALVCQPDGLSDFAALRSERGGTAAGEDTRHRADGITYRRSTWTKPARIDLETAIDRPRNTNATRRG
jgi:hypothetical protein